MASVDQTAKSSSTLKESGKNSGPVHLVSDTYVYKTSYHAGAQTVDCEI